MFPGVSPRELKRMLKRMGINVKELKNVNRITLETNEKVFIIEDPQVLMFDSGKQKIFQIIANRIIEETAPMESKKEALEISLSDEDIKFVAEQAGVSLEKAREALIKTKGDLAEAILLLRESGS
ncbi:MAG: NagC family transcriptional regulator [Desulfurococcales archaeon]|nr:NagC family transcriptional regulator [Desulfurococcales archaeon]